MMTFPLRERDPEPSSLSRLAALLRLPAPDEEVEIRGVAPIGKAGPDQLGLLADRRYLGGVPGTRAGALLVSRELSTLLPEGAPPSLVVEDAHLALITILESFFPSLPADPEIHPTAVLGRGVRLGARVRIGPYAVIEDSAAVGGRRVHRGPRRGGGGRRDRILLDPPPARRPLPGRGPRGAGDPSRRGPYRGGRLRVRRRWRAAPEGAAGRRVRHRGRRRDRSERDGRPGLDRGNAGLHRGEARQSRPPRPQRFGGARCPPRRPRRGSPGPPAWVPGSRRGGSPVSPGTSRWAPVRGWLPRRG